MFASLVLATKRGTQPPPSKRWATNIKQHRAHSVAVYRKSCSTESGGICLVVFCLDADASVTGCRCLHTLGDLFSPDDALNCFKRALLQDSMLIVAMDLRKSFPPLNSALVPPLEPSVRGLWPLMVMSPSL